MKEHASISRPELLAPAGTWESLEAVIDAGADAVYLGGKKFNMRLHRSSHNFSDDELEKAREYTKARGVKLYITLNNLMTQKELEEALPFLDFLEKLQPDALILQDLGLLHFLHARKTSIPLHASVMMNTHSLEMLKWLKEFGVSRVIASREMSLMEIHHLKEKIAMEFEYFIHGDMCFAQSGQCLHSGILFGASSNRGRCMKPCRWAYRLDDREDALYHLAVKDMCMLPHLPELILAGVCSFKIEGRMRPAEYLVPIVKGYRQEIDRYLEDPLGYSLDVETYRELYEKRVRDFSPAYAFGNPGKAFIGFDGSREPMVFSTAVEEPILEKKDIPVISGKLRKDIPEVPTGAPRLSVTVKDMDSFYGAIEEGADILYIGGDIHRPASPWGRKAIEEAVEAGKKKQVEVILRTPVISMAREMEDMNMLAALGEELQVDGIMVANPGELYLFQRNTSLSLIGDYSFNVMNKEALDELKEWGIERASLSLECSSEQMKQLMESASLPMEVLVQGPLPAMISDHSLADILQPQPVLIDQKGYRHEVRMDQYGRNTIFLGHHISLLPFLKELGILGVEVVRIDGRDYESHDLKKMVALYRKHLDRMQREGSSYQFTGKDFDQLKDSCPVPFGPGSFIR